MTIGGLITIAINIFSGGSSAKTPKKSRLKGIVETVQGKAAPSGLAKVTQKIGSFAEKFGGLIPGVGGVVSKIGGLLSKNDPEWWQNVPGTGISTNQPLSPLDAQVQFYNHGADSYSTATVKVPRVGILEFSAVSSKQKESSEATPFQTAIAPSSSMITTYLMQNVRKVVNAVPLQSPNAYRAVFMVQATAYALKHQLDKLIVLTTHSMPYLPSFTDGSYEILNSENYSKLVGMRDRLAEYCKASVRLPHTLCQYLAWRFGRIYKARRSSKSTLVLYNVLPLEYSVADYIQYTNWLLGYVASDNSALAGADTTGVTATAKQAAQSDLFNAYMHHVTDVPVPFDTQFIFDPKEFVLRTNLDVYHTTGGIGIPYSAAGIISGSIPLMPDPEMVYMDSELDNKTTFMASTVSTAFGNHAELPLFPVLSCQMHYAGNPNLGATYKIYTGDYTSSNVTYHGFLRSSPGAWYRCYAGELMGRVVPDPTSGAGGAQLKVLTGALFLTLASALSCDLYNAEIYAPIDDLSATKESISGNLFDLTAPSFDLGRVESAILENSQVYAFANLVFDGVTSYAAREMPKAIEEAKETLKVAAETAVPNLTVTT